MNQPRWTTALVALALAATPSALPHKKGNHADDWTPGQTIKVCVCDTPGGEDISGPLQNAMTIWNNSKGGFNGGVLFEWHLSLTDCSEPAPAECDVRIGWDPGTSWGAVEPGMDPVEVNSTVGDGLNDRGVQRVLMHELGHVKGLGHSALSDIMKWNFRGQGGNSPTAADLNGADAFETPNADDIALNKLLHGIEPPKSIAEIIADVIQEAINLWRFLYILQGQIGPGLVDKITRFTVEVPSPVNGQTELQVVTLPPGWQAAYIPGEPAGAPGTSLDEDEELQSAILTFWTDDPQFGVGPGESLPFEVLSPWGPVMRRAFTNSPNADTAEFLVPVPAGEGAALQIVRAGNVPNPEVFLPGVTSGPVIGQVWDPVVDHSSFLPAALADFMLISAIPTDVPLGPPGTLLCLPPYALTLFNFTPAAPWAVPIPNEPTFVGLGLCAQAGSSPDGSSFQLTNALDLLIGLY